MAELLVSFRIFFDLRVRAAFVFCAFASWILAVAGLSCFGFGLALFFVG